MAYVAIKDNFTSPLFTYICFLHLLRGVGNLTQQLKSSSLLPGLIYGIGRSFVC